MAELYLDAVIETALSEVGYQSNGKFNKYSKTLDAVKFYNYPKDGVADFCKIFFDYCIYLNTNPQTADAARAMVYEPDKDNCGAGCTQSVQYYKNHGAWIAKPSDAHIGDEIFFKNGSGAYYHTGIVYDWDKKGLYTVEANADGGKTVKRFYYYSDAKIGGFGRPAYTVNEIPLPEPEPTPEPQEKQYRVKVKSYLNIREGAGTKYKEVGRLQDGATVTVYEEQNNFCRITGSLWVSKDYLREV